MDSFRDNTTGIPSESEESEDDSPSYSDSEDVIKMPGRKIKPRVLTDSDSEGEEKDSSSPEFYKTTYANLSTNSRKSITINELKNESASTDDIQSDINTNFEVSEEAQDCDINTNFDVSEEAQVEKDEPEETDYFGDVTQSFMSNAGKFNSTTVQECAQDNNLAENSDDSSTDLFGNTLVLTDSSVKIIQESIDEIIISDEEDGPAKVSAFKPFVKPNTTIRQPTLLEVIKKEINPKPDVLELSPAKKTVSRMDYLQMKQKLETLHYERRKLQMAIGTIKLQTLPDNGHALLSKQKELDLDIREQEMKFENIQVKDEAPSPVTWRGIEQGASTVQPRTFGKQALETYNNERALTLDRLHNLHASLKNCPTPETIADDPKGIKVELMLHQKQALAWLLWREHQKPAGGILADDMGLGKTLTMISLMLACKQQQQENEEESSESEEDTENEEEQRAFKYNGGTLIVCPASLLGQWANEVSDKLKGSPLSVEIYHGSKRETKAKRLSRYDMVITTYAICQSEGESDTPIYRIKWQRIILDEAHQIRNHKSKTSVAVFRLGGKKRWALTGTPVHNKELDLFALLKFLRCSPFDDIAVFKRWISSKNGGGNQRLHTVLQSMLLRRTKEQLKEMDQLTCLPEREWQLVEIQMDKDELEVYQKILLFSKTLFAQFLHQRAEKNADAMEYDTFKMNDPANEYFKMHKKLVQMNKLPEVKQSDILVLLLRLRQICCHPSLITAMLDNVADIGDDVEDGDISIDLLDQLNKMNIDDHDQEQESHQVLDGAEGIGLAEASRNLLNPSNPIFEKDRQSAKLREVIKLLHEKIMPLGDKTIIVSQWTSLLRLMVPHLEALNIKYCHLDGSVPVKSRGEIVYNFNNPQTEIKVMLLSLTAGGVGLNLVGANHLIFLDLHWNPQLEMQAQDRIYRVGQRKKVNIYKFMTVDTIEQRIKHLQDKKKELAEDMLKGSKTNQAKLSMDDLKMLFNM